MGCWLIRKRWEPHPDLLNVDGALFGFSMNLNS